LSTLSYFLHYDFWTNKFNLKHLMWNT
jgi:hypothetical protein